MLLEIPFKETANRQIGKTEADSD